MNKLQKKILHGKATIDEWIEWETRARKAQLWGHFINIKPVVAKKIMGDGKQLIYIGTVDQRPNYWLLKTL